ncbi:mitofilin family membrane protein [Roseiarcaceae bacterium H3SJ34-1]|uniref:mitofilin family membrane protein n=1 Tax=Terripilifer ovatus TaxID=3032367 RepID=UPI003AB9BA61|nr:mitofilin family membrane protein [Roseiarcaceae bacterium H3SJ34-1]
MNDDKPRDPGENSSSGGPFPSARPVNRGTRREPATIDARAQEVTPEDVTPKPEPATPVEPEPAQQENPAAAEAAVAQAAEEASAGESPPKEDPEPSRTLEGPPANSLPPGGGSGFFRLAAASVVGAAVALGAAAGLQKLNAPAEPDAQPMAALESRISAAEAKLGAAQARLAETPTAASISALEKRVAAAEALAKTASAPQPALQSTPGVDTAALARLEQRLTALEKAPAANSAPVAVPRPAGPPATAAVPPDLDKRLAALETALTAQKSTERATESRIEAIAATPPVDIKPLEARVAAVEQRLQPLQATVASTSDALKTTSARAETDAARANAAALAVAAQALAQAIDRGAPLQPQIDSLTRLGVARDKTAALEPFAAKGAVSLHDLSRQFTALERRLLETDSKPAADTGLMDRLSQATQKLLRARPAGDSTGTTPPDLVARIQAALNGGNLPRAIAAWELLPPAAKDISADWVAAARQRQAADAAAQAILADALAGVSRSKT